MRKLIGGVCCVVFACAVAAGLQQVERQAAEVLVGLLFVPPLYVRVRRLAGVRGWVSMWC